MANLDFAGTVIFQSMHAMRYFIAIYRNTPIADQRIRLMDINLGADGWIIIRYSAPNRVVPSTT
jgi:hypothetical protein